VVSVLCYDSSVGHNMDGKCGKGALISEPTSHGIVSRDGQGGRVGDRRHAGLLALQLLPVDDEEEQEEDDQQHQDDDAGDGSDLVGVHRRGRAGQAVQVAHDHLAGWWWTRSRAACGLGFGEESVATFLFIYKGQCILINSTN